MPYLLVSVFADKFFSKTSFVFKYIYLSPFGKYSDLIFTPLH